MLTFYWICLMGGVLFAVITIVFGDILGDLLDGFFEVLSMDGLDLFQPVVLVGGITVLGGTGIMLDQSTNLEAFPILLLSLMASAVISLLVYFSYVRPMKNSENSTGFSMQDLVGKIGEVTIPIPEAGYGEVLIKVGAGNTNQIAASLDEEEIPAGAKVVVIEARDSTVYVFQYEDE
ncbi:NfeD family protein [Desulforamulus ruminis]|uniref:NfeD family protein n=1 Tax=Desulforamulus ruminis TaxID=1564 RepID=UPI00235598D3|nr:NfeD family protein [Desulforamulus ruminis]